MIDIEQTLWDVLVIGAGPAGTLAARELARRGLRTLLVDGKSFPRHKVCGGYLNGRALSVLRLVGLETLCEDLGGKLLSQVEIRAGSQKASILVPTGVAISRRTLDSALVDEARRAGVEFLPQTRATVTSHSDSTFRRVQLQPQHGSPAWARSKVVLACDGLSHSSLQGLKMFASRIAPSARIGVGGITVDPSSCYPAGKVFMTIGRRGYVGITRVESGQICLASALDVDFVREVGMRGAVLRVLGDAGMSVSQSLRAMTLHGTPPLTRQSPAIADERLFLVGDAAGYVEPFTGEGMAMAWTGAVAITPIAARAAESWDPRLIAQWKRRYRSAIGKRLGTCRAVTSLLHHPWAVRTAIRVLSVYPQLSNPIVHRINQAPVDWKASTS
jgi:flavin-dependent dehydrogenase